MEKASAEVPQVPPEVARYLQGPPEESRQFDFLIGDWDVIGSRYKENGDVLMQYMAMWSARYLNQGRIVMDDFKAYAPTGQEISSMVTLRTYCETTRRWEITGLAAHQPAWNAEWHGQWLDGEMLLDACGKASSGVVVKNRIRFFDIEEKQFRWESRMSFDEGKTWIKSASLVAKRAAVSGINRSE
ncbi:MAG: hypothetical protein HYS18_08090 [Burkholderiales bacterium]|nr:hypothetical protein [Burkholderiales bacterium]